MSVFDTQSVSRTFLILLTSHDYIVSFHFRHFEPKGFVVTVRFGHEMRSPSGRQKDVKKKQEIEVVFFLLVNVFSLKIQVFYGHVLLVTSILVSHHHQKT